MVRIDRLSGLPDAVLLKILSLLDTKIVVQTSILSTRWRLIWKDVPVLNFYQDSFGTLLQFEQHVDQVLALRSDCHLVKISTNFQVRENNDMFDRILRYADSHNIQQLCVLRFYEEFPFTIWFDSVAAISICHRSLGVLELQYGNLYEATFEALSSLKMLKTLSLSMCEFCFDGVDGHMDPFANFSKLENLKVVHCRPDEEGSDAVVRVSGSQLLTLEIHHVLFGDIEIFAPKLESFSYWVEIHFGPRLASRIDLPSLKHATVNLWRMEGSRGRDYDQVLLRRFVTLFGRLHNVHSLSLHFDTSEFLFQVRRLIEDQPSPFEHLKSLNLTLCCEGPLSIPYYVTRYFLEGSQKMEDNLVIAKKVPNWCDPYCCLHFMPYDPNGPPRR